MLNTIQSLRTGKLAQPILRKYLGLSSLLVAALLGSCSQGSQPSAVDNNQNLSAQLVIERAAIVPVLDGKSTSTGVYVRNLSNQRISGIDYSVVHNSAANLTLVAGACASIAANSSCLLGISTPALAVGMSGSNIVVANFNGEQSKQLINYRYFNSSSYTGVSFSDKSQSLYGTNNYATSYVFVGKNQAQKNIGFSSSSDSMAVASGLTNGKLDLAVNQVVPLELHSNQNVTANLVTLTPYTVTTSKNLAHGLQAAALENEQLQVTITPQQQQANILVSVIPVLTQANSTVTLTLFNNGNSAATNVTLNAADANLALTPAATNPCTSGANLNIGASCNYQLQLNNNSSNGSSSLILNYNALPAVNLPVYFLNQASAPMVALVPQQSTYTSQINQTTNITFDVTNLGNVPLSNALITVKKTGLANTTLSIVNNTCPATIAGHANCLLEVQVAASNQIDSGIIYLNASGSVGTTNYSFMSKPVSSTISDPTLPTITSTTPQDSATDVSIATGITVNFSEAMDPTTLNASNIWLEKVSDGSIVNLVFQGVSLNNQTVTFTLAHNLISNTAYRIMFNPSQIKDANGSVLGITTSQTASSFTTHVAVAPTITNFSPANGATNQSRTPAISLNFSADMDPATLTPSNIVLKTQAGVLVSGYTISYNSTTYVATLNLNGTQLLETTTYLLVLNQPNITNLEGDALGANSAYTVISFTTGDFTAPTLASNTPTNGATGVAIESPISLTFSEAMDTSTLTTTTVTLQKARDSSTATLNAPVFSNNNQTVTFQPSVSLSAGESYNLVINPSAIKDVAGNAMGAATSQTVSSFTTQAPVIVGTISLPQTGQVMNVPTGCTTGASGCYTSVAGTDGYGYLSSGFNIPYGITWAYNGSGVLNPTTRFTAGTGAEANCVTDNLTGLMWIKNLNTINGGAVMAWQAALNLIATANSGVGYCGHKDWYLPTVNDLSSLLNDGMVPYTWLNSQGFSNVQANKYWSSSTIASSPDYAWVVNFNYGSVVAGVKYNGNYVWPVRGGQ